MSPDVIWVKSLNSRVKYRANDDYLELMGSNIQVFVNMEYENNLL